MKRITIFALFVFMISWFYTITFADTIHSLPDPNYSDRSRNMQTNPITPVINYIIYPTIGLPSIVTPGNILYVAVSYDDLDLVDGIEAEIVTAGDIVQQNYAISIEKIKVYPTVATALLTCRIPIEAPVDMYDLHVSTTEGQLSDVQYNCVKVTDHINDTFQILHFTDPQKDDPSGWLGKYNCSEKELNPFTAIDQIIGEIRFLDPDIAFLTGDIVFGLDYSPEYDYMFTRLKYTGVPVFMIPGNHDGYAAEEGGELKRDGLNHYRETFGPMYYSFEYGSFLFVGMNSYDDPRSRRTGTGILVPQWGGRVEPPAMDWIESQLKYGTQKSKNIICFGHHDPRGPYNSIPYAPGQVWNHKPSGVEIRSLFDTYDVAYYLYGHEHGDKVSSEANTVYIETTTCSSSSGTGCWGYRWIEVENGRVTRYNYLNDQNQSIPLGNINVTYTNNDGNHTNASASVENDLLTEVSGKIEFYMPYNPKGYVVSGGEIMNMVDFGSHSIYYVQALVTAESTLNVTIDPAGN